MHTFSFEEPSISVRHLDAMEEKKVSVPCIRFDVRSGLSSMLQKDAFTAETPTIIIESDYGFSEGMFPHREAVMHHWSHVYDIFPLPHLKETNLWRSPKERVGNAAFNLWFAAEGTDCGIHNTHDFLEVHTQIWGKGHMQKFRENDAATLFEDIPMTPGFTHEPFCDKNLVYPWHRYYADTDCVWLAVEYDKQQK